MPAIEPPSGTISCWEKPESSSDSPFGMISREDRGNAEKQRSVRLVELVLDQRTVRLKPPADIQDAEPSTR
jgi:hypothetical protein